MTGKTKGEGPVADVHRRLDALEQRMRSAEDSIRRIAADLEFTPEVAAELDETITGARPDEDPEMRERVGQTLGVEDRTHAPVGTYVSQPFGNLWHVELVQVSEDRKHAIEAAWGFVDSLRAPLRAECERLRERVRELEAQNKRNADNFSELSSGYLERAEKAEAALADCQRERDHARRPARFRDPTWCPDCDDEAMIDDSDGGICQGCGTMTAADKRDAVAEARKQERERCAKVAEESPTAEIAARRIRSLPTEPESEGDQ